jgi:ABC-type multidrug transport system ATPase subunit/pSer/pThr/pTyr-binding forkhead associated (FHA) protein
MNPKLNLSLFENGLKRRKIDFSPFSKLSLGRIGFRNDVELDDPCISRKHAEIELKELEVGIKDNGSLNGTFLNGKKLQPNKIYTLKVNDEITFGHNSRFSLQYSLESADLAPEKSEDLAKDLISYFKDKTEIKIGRNPTADIFIDDLTVSRNHALLIKEGNEYYVKDCSSLNGTYINNRKVIGKAKFDENDTLYIGLNAFRLNEQARDFSKEPAITALSVEKVYSNGYVGVHKMNVSVANKEFVVMMGPSGCGKSTLLKMLNYDTPASSGSVKIYGLELSQHYEMLKRKIGYVPQDDIVHHGLSVEDSLYFAAKLRLPDDTTEEAINERITEVLKSLNINDTVIRNTNVGQLSGGQRKRVSIAVELLNNPSILFLDEPTSPLDPETIEEFMKCLKTLNNGNTTIVMVTHKPEDLNFADKVIFIGANGYHVFYGSPKEFLEYFDKKRIIEVYSLVRQKSEAMQLYQSWYDSKNYLPEVQYKQVVKRDTEQSLLRQYYWLSRRYLRLKVNDSYNLILLIAQPIIIAVLLLLVFENFTLGVLFLMAISAVWFGVSNAAKEIVSEIPIYKRERMFNLSTTTYLCSKITVLALIAFVQVLTFVSIIYAGYRIKENHGIYLGGFWDSASFMFYLSVSSSLLGLFLSAIFNTSEKVMTFVPIALIPQIMLAGVVTQIESKAIELMSYCTLGRWGTQGLALIQDKYFQISKTTGSVIQVVPGKEPAVVNTVGAVNSLGFYSENIDLLKYFANIGDVVGVMLVMNIFLFFGIYYKLKTKAG